MYHSSNKDKTTFMIERANYYYMVMPFGLKNIKATYQRLMDTILRTLWATSWKFMLMT